MKRFFALSRTTHGVLDLALPGFVALLWLGEFPPILTIALSLFTAFAAYTAIYALNDLVGIAVDREKFAGGINAGYSVEASDLRYPLAQNALSYNKGLLWFGGWFAVALIGAYFLNPFIIVILLAAALLEIIYVLLLKVTYLRTFVSGLVKSSGPIAAIYVVDNNPPIPLVLLILAWVFVWEIGGQNVPADWNDTAEDKRVNARTIPLQLGTQTAGIIVLITLSLTVLLSLFLPLASPLNLGWPYRLASAAAGAFLLLKPGYDLYRQQTEGRMAAKLFDNASFYPMAQLAIITVFVLI
ncbi:MAG: ubiquinone biosynthesis protein UbiA [Chloroflexi bacterium CFX1]|nr:ubiquinone biosynthesis protein UbiA [Chloroflexi bacterium CFX1]MCQ3953689.1 ubiquinone biosynthesis protein UbiA [Chloroflexota bacterium]MDL1920122.1 ubiquinone biosynthesis protein UbiA [Chloroflexi bacterium CFX5]NUQ59390.1 UbiA family prenyltransferase [Anaerolineales bacterium]